MLMQVYGKEAVSRKCVYECLKRFREGKETTEDESRSGRPSSSRIPEMIEKVRQMLAQDQGLTLTLTAEELGISKDKAHTIVCDDLGKRKIFSRFVPHKLTDEQKGNRMETCGNFNFHVWQGSVASGKQRRGRLELVLSVRSKRQSKAWCSPISPLPKKKKKESFAKIQGENTVDRLPLLQRYYPEGICSFRSNHYCRILPRSFEPIVTAYPAGSVRDVQDWKRMLLHDNDPAHSAIPMRQFLAQKMVGVNDHLPKPPDLAPADFFLFPRLKAPSMVHVLRTWMPSKICDSHFAMDSTGALCWLFPEAVRTLSNCVVADDDYFEGE